MKKLELVKECARILNKPVDDLIGYDEDTLMEKVVARLLIEGYKLEHSDGGGIAFYKSY